MTRVAIVPGDGAAAEAVRAVAPLLRSLRPEVEWLTPPVGDEALGELGSRFPDSSRDAIDSCDTALLGAVDQANVAVLRHLRWGRRTFANVRPIRSLAPHSRRWDFVIVRENLEDVYVQIEGSLSELQPCVPHLSGLGAGRYAIRVATMAGAIRVAQFAFGVARERLRRNLTSRVVCATKANVLPSTDGLFVSAAHDVALEHPDVEFETMLADEAMRLLVHAPDEFGVLLLPNLYGDLASGVAAGIVGSPGLLPSGCYGEDFAYFEPVHGSAPDLAGRNRINPTATILSASMMFRYLGFSTDADALDAAVADLQSRAAVLTPDQGGTATTTDVVETIATSVGVSPRCPRAQRTSS